MHQHGLGLVVGIVPHGDGSRPDGGSYPAHKRIPGPAGGLFDSQAMLLRQCRHVRLFDRVRQVPIGSELSDEGGVGVGVRTAKTMV
jgi:hypothetical protein